MFRQINVWQKVKDAVSCIKKISTKKMILAAGISLIGVLSFGRLVDAAPSVEVQCKKVGESTTSYQLKLTECNYSNLANDIKIYKTAVDNDNKLDVEVLEKLNKKDVLAVVKVENTVNNLVIEDSSEGEGQNVVLIGENINIPEANAISVKGNLIKYNSAEYGKYIHATFESQAKIWKIEDQTGNERTWLKEKEKNGLVTLRYILNDGDTEFTVYDVFGNSKRVDIGEALIEVEFNAKNVDGSTFVFKASKEFEKDLKKYELAEITTGAFEEITMHTSDEEGAEWKDNYIYTNVPEGTTKLLLTYKVDDNDVEEFVVPLWLDVTDPEGIYYKIDKEEVLSSYEINGEIKENNYDKYVIERVKGDIRKYTTDVPNAEGEDQQISVRAYVNNANKKCIVEVRDIQSGIAKIELCKTVHDDETNEDIYQVITSEDPEVQAAINSANYDAKGKLEASVLHLFDFSGYNVSEGEVTAVKVTDGLENDMTIEVTTSESRDEQNVENDTDTLVLVKLIEEHDDNGKVIYKVVAQDYKAGLWKMTRDVLGTNGDIEQSNPLIDFSDANQLTVNEGLVEVEKDQANGVVKYVGEEGNVEDETNNHVEITIDGDEYEQYTLRRVTRTVTQKGLPTITVYDALGNTRQVTFDELAFGCTYATYNETDALAVNIKETRGIWKITAQIVDAGAPEEPTPTEPEPEKPGVEPESPSPETMEEGEEEYARWKAIKDAHDAWETKNSVYQDWLDTKIEVNDIDTYPNRDWVKWNENYRHEYTLEVFREDNEPTRLIKTYQVPAGEVEKINVYNTRDIQLNNEINKTPRGEYCAALTSLKEIKDELANAEDKQEVLNKLINVTSADLKTEGEGENKKITAATVHAYHGIKRVTYEDGTVMEFYRELPTKLLVNCKLGDDFNGATVIDATGCPITIKQDKVTLNYLEVVDGSNGLTEITAG